MSARNAADGLDLGRYEQVLRKSLLEKGPYDLQALVARQNLTLGELGRIDFAINPYRQRLGELNTWHFAVGGLDFHLLTDQRRFDPQWSPFLANGNEVLHLTSIDRKDIREVPMLRGLLDRMTARS